MVDCRFAPNPPCAFCMLPYTCAIIQGDVPIFLLITLAAYFVGRIKASNEPEKQRHILSVGMFVGMFWGLVLGRYMFMFFVVELMYGIKQ